MKSYEVCESAFTEKECDQIIDYSQNYSQLDGEISSGVNREARNNFIRWIPRSEEILWVYDRVLSKVWKANLFNWMFDIDESENLLQFGSYQQGQYYFWHTDIGEGEMSLRKLSVSVQLSNPNDYTGGDLLLYSGRRPEEMDRNRGSIIIFPSYTLHSVSKVTRGRRCSLVLWVKGKRGFR